MVMNHEKGFYLGILLFIGAMLIACIWKANYDLAKQNEIGLLHVIIKQDSIRANQQDTIRVLKFKLNTLKND